MFIWRPIELKKKLEYQIDDYTWIYLKDHVNPRFYQKILVANTKIIVALAYLHYCWVWYVASKISCCY